MEEEELTPEMFTVLVHAVLTFDQAMKLLMESETIPQMMCHYNYIVKNKYNYPLVCLRYAKEQYEEKLASIKWNCPAS